MADVQRRLAAREVELRDAAAKMKRMEQDYGETTSRLRVQVWNMTAART